MVCLFQHPDIMVHQHHRVAIGNQTVHHVHQAVNIRRMKPDAGLVQHIQDARCFVADGAGQLHPLPFTGRERIAGPVKGKIPEAQVN